MIKESQIISEPPVLEPVVHDLTEANHDMVLGTPVRVQQEFVTKETFFYSIRTLIKSVFSLQRALLEEFTLFMHNQTESKYTTTKMFSETQNEDIHQLIDHLL